MSSYKLTSEREREILRELRNVVGIRLFGTMPDGSEILRDFNSVSEAREAIPTDAVDWVIFELVAPAKRSLCGRVLDSI